MIDQQSATVLSKRFILFFSDISSISEHLKTHSCSSSKYRKILPENATILHKEKNKSELQILEAQYININKLS